MNLSMTSFPYYKVIITKHYMIIISNILNENYADVFVSKKKLETSTLFYTDKNILITSSSSSSIFPLATILPFCIIT